MKTNTKNNVLKLAMTIVATFMFAAAMGQTYPGSINHTGDVGNYVEVETNETHQTVNLGFTLYAAPDPVYSPDYVGLNHDGTEARGTGLNGASEWQWVWGTTFADGVTDGDISKPWTAAQNWVELVAPAATGTRTYWAAERFGAACADATGTSHVVHFIGDPTGVMIGQNDGNSWGVETADVEFLLCNEGHSDLLEIAFTEIAPTGVTPSNNYAYNISVTREGFDINNTSVSAGVAESLTSISTTATDGVGGFAASPISGISTGTMNFVIDGTTPVRTKYVFTLDEVSSKTRAVSVVRDGGTGNNFVAVTGQTVTYWLNLPPVTGPIYHIPNDFAL